MSYSGLKFEWSITILGENQLRVPGFGYLLLLVGERKLPAVAIAKSMAGLVRRRSDGKVIAI